MTYRYKVVPFIGRNRGRLSSDGVAGQLEALISQYAGDGWEFYQLSDVNIEVQPGCIAGLFGVSAQYVRFDQLIFRTNEETHVRSAERPREERDNRADQSIRQQIVDEPVLPSKSLQVDQPERQPLWTNSKFAAVWRQKSDTQIREAVGSLHQYTDESREAILEEFEWRSLEPDTESERAALQVLRESRRSASSQTVVRREHGAVRDDEMEDSLAYCYHCGSDVAPGSRQCVACGNTL